MCTPGCASRRACIVLSRSCSSFSSSICRARPVQAALLDERDDQVQLAGVEERPVPTADVDDRARQAPEVDAVHHLSARDAFAVANLRGFPHRRRGPLMQHGGLRGAVGADVLEGRRVDPRRPAPLALQQRRGPDRDFPHRPEAVRAPRRPRPARRPGPPRAALRTVDGALEHQREAGRAAHRRQGGVAVLTALISGSGGPAAVRAVQRMGVGCHAVQVE